MRVHSASLMRKLAEGMQREMLQAEQRVGRKDQRPDLREVGVGETEGFEHGSARRARPSAGAASSDIGCPGCTRRTRCQTLALASISAKNEPAIWASNALKSIEGG